MNRFLPPEAFVELNDGIGEVLFSADEIATKVHEMGQAISLDYNGRFPLIVGVLKGVVPFMADLLRAITIPVEIDFLAIASYSAETRERGLVRLEKDLEESIKDRHVLFVEDMIDTGLTLNYLLRNLRAREPASVEVCALFNKPRRRLIDMPVKYKGFDLPDRFVVGYGLDYRGKYRNLPFVGLLKPEVFQPKNNNTG
ncbi:MAG: hypoxanthine phosphoribosyltransferase [Ardenticatenaceae bacterium]|nr:hypoxanthine phosphoribosyltransferase [Anaerolineales bacterium]MCB9009734.1 hypoxanthine phosphoribosyltransferase [Ardenticatenaceae bacterium]